MTTEIIEFADCGSLSISFDATGKATVSLVVLRNDNNIVNISRYTNRTWGYTSFDLIAMSMSPSPIVGTTWKQWSLNMEGIGN
jgi:hypothetical protein